MWKGALGNDTTHVMVILCVAGVLITVVGVIIIQLVMNWYRARKKAFEAYAKAPTEENRVCKERYQKFRLPALLAAVEFLAIYGIVSLAFWLCENI